MTISSLGHRYQADIHFDDLQWERSYSRVGAYGQSKLANLMFTFALDRRLRTHGATTIAAGAHPGLSATELDRHMPRLLRGPVIQAISQPPAMGALPALRGATDPTVNGGDYFGPGGFMETRGHPTLAHASARARRHDIQDKLWAVSEELTGVGMAL